MDYDEITDFFYNITHFDNMILDSDGNVLSKKVSLTYPKEIKKAFIEYLDTLVCKLPKLNPGEYYQEFFSDFYTYFLLLCDYNGRCAIVGPYCYNDIPNDIIYRILQKYKVPSALYLDYKKWHQLIPLNFRPLTTATTLMLTLLQTGVCSGHCIDTSLNSIPILTPPREYTQTQTLRNARNQYFIEDRIRTAIQKGNTYMALQELANGSNRFEYRSDGYSLWHIQHKVTVMGTLMRIAAREGGVPPQTVHEISERYYYRINKCRNEGEAEALLPQMIKDYCHAVQYAKLASYSPIVQSAVSYLHVHYREKLTLTEIADAIPCHPNYLCQRFKKETNTSVIQMLTDIRLDYACMELKASDIPITQIASLVGFDSYGYFSIAFKKKYGCSCSQWRTL